MGDIRTRVRQVRIRLIAETASLTQSYRSNTEVRPTITSLTSLAKLLCAFSTLSEPYIELTTSHYADTAASNMSSVEGGTMSATRYIEWTLQKVDEERERASACLSPEVAEEVVKVVRHVAGEKMGGRIVRRGQFAIPFPQLLPSICKVIGAERGQVESRWPARGLSSSRVV